jgi:hypothetical protein
VSEATFDTSPERSFGELLAVEREREDRALEEFAFPDPVGLSSAPSLLKVGAALALARLFGIGALAVLAMRGQLSAQAVSRALRVRRLRFRFEAGADRRLPIETAPHDGRRSDPCETISTVSAGGSGIVAGERLRRGGFGWSR